MALSVHVDCVQRLVLEKSVSCGSVVSAGSRLPIAAWQPAGAWKVFSMCCTFWLKFSALARPSRCGKVSQSLLNGKANMNEWQWERVRNAGYRENRDKRRELQVFSSDVLYTFDSVEKAERFLGQFLNDRRARTFCFRSFSSTVVNGQAVAPCPAVLFEEAVPVQS